MTGWQGRKDHQHIPSEHPVIPRETVDLAHQVLLAQMAGEPHPVTGEAVTRDQATNAERLLKLYQTQDRYTPERVKQLAETPKASQSIKELATLTDDDLNALTEQMLTQA